MNDNFDVQNKEKILELKSFIKLMDNNKNNLISILHKTQDLFGYIPKYSMELIGEELKISLAKVYGVVTFYNNFKLEKTGEYAISICQGTACFVKGASKIQEEFEKELNIKQGETTEDGMFSLADVRCAGACSLAPVISINGKIMGNIQTADVKDIIEKCRRGDL